MSSANYKLIFSSNTCILQDANTKVKIGTAEVSRGLYQLIPEAIKSHTMCTTIIHPQCKVTPINLWHFRMGHPSLERLRAMQSYYPFLSSSKDFVCTTCHYAKHKRLSFSSSISHASTIFELLHIDIWGPCSKTSMHGHRYFLTIIDDFSRYTWTHLMHTKVETCQIIINFIA